MSSILKKNKIKYTLKLKTFSRFWLKHFKNKVVLPMRVQKKIIILKGPFVSKASRDQFEFRKSQCIVQLKLNANSQKFAYSSEIIERWFFFVTKSTVTSIKIFKLEKNTHF